MLNAIQDLQPTTTTDLNPPINHDQVEPSNKQPVAVRLYENTTYGTTYGRGLYRRALYNGTVDLKQSGIKYLLDLYTGEDWANQA
ncbi:MAG: hypothetical protein EB069_05915, partial [Actinobacteria bacterium]|nr:hypothetical protein [Actinomycetota bacterium]